MKNFFTIWSIFVFIVYHFQCNPYSLPEDKNIDADKTAYAHYLQSAELYNSGDYDQALEEINTAISYNNNFAQFYQLRGDIYKAQFKYPAALQSYEESVKYRSNFSYVYRNMGEIYFILGQYEEALKVFRKVRANEPTDLYIYLQIAECYMELNELEIAYNDLSDYRRLKLVSDEPLDPEYYKLLGTTYFRFKRYADAVTQLEKYRSYEAKDVNSLFLLGKAYYQIKNFEAGLNCFNQLIKIDESVGQWYLYRGIYFYQKNDFEDAESQLLYALNLDSTIVEAHLFLGKIYEMQGKNDQALDHLRLYRENMRDIMGSMELENVISNPDNSAEPESGENRKP
jgi:tetratricopeptide (TPR) repeat protein